MKSFHASVAGFVGVIAFVLAAPVVARGTGKEPKADVTVSDAEDGKTIHIKQNQTLEVRLAGNLTTGYEWHAVGGWKDDGKAWGNEEVGVLAPGAEHVYIETHHAEGMVGVGGTDVYCYIARKPGTETLRFIQLRPWEQGQVAVRRSFKIVVD